MTTLRQRWLDQLIKECQCNQKENAWHTAKALEENELLTGIATDLEQAMKQLQRERQQSGGLNDKQR